MRAWEIDPSILQAPIIDIGAGSGPLDFPGVVCWDKIFGDGDATFMDGVADESYQTVYSCHCLEHIDDPITALRNWWRILRKRGHLVITIPSRKYYEKRRTLPSIFNPDHKTFWHLTNAEPPNTFSFLDTVTTACPYAELLSLRLVLDGYIELPPNQQSPEGFHLEGVWRK
jgi:SAM-dependent methyltransferase